MNRLAGGAAIVAGKLMVFLGYGVVLTAAIASPLAWFLESEIGTFLEEHELALLLVLASAVVFAITGPMLISRGKRMRAPGAEALLRADPRPPILLLRPFYHDAEQAAYQAERSTGGWFSSLDEELSVEKMIVDAVRSRGPVIAIGRPGEKLPPHGAARLYVSDDQWQDKVLEVAEKAQLVLLILGFTTSMQWEIEQATTRFLGKTVFIVPPRLTGGPWREGWRALRTRFPFLEEEYAGIVAFRIASSEDVRYLRMTDWQGEWRDRIRFLDMILPNPRGLYVRIRDGKREAPWK